MAGRQHHRLSRNGVALARRVVQSHDADDAVGAGEERGDGGFLERADVVLLKLLAPAVHQQHARLALLQGGDVAHAPDAGDDIALVVAPEVEPGLVEFGIEGLLDPAPAFTR